jgi:2-methylcitrate dehydratase PrpD
VNSTVGTTQQLADYFADLKYEDIPKEVVAMAKNLILDAIGCSYAGWSAKEIDQIINLARIVGGAGNSTVIGTAERFSLLGATIANGYLITSITACDVYTPAHFHATPEVVPVALALAEELNATGKELITAVVCGLEVVCRIAFALDNQEFRRKGWHSPGVVGPMGAAVTAAKLLKLDATDIRRAIALGYSQSSGTFASWPTPTVKFHQARGAAAGLISGLLAREKFESSAEPLEMPDGGLFVSYASGTGEKVVKNLGTHWELLNISLRLWPGATPIQAMLSAFLNDEKKKFPELNEIRSVEIRVAPRTYTAHISSIHPTSTFEALLSFHFVAAAFLKNGYFWIDLVSPNKLEDQEVLDFAMNQVELIGDEGVPIGGVQVKILLNDGSSIELKEDFATGTPKKPVTAEQLENKFLKASAEKITPESSDELIKLMSHLENFVDCGEIFSHLRSPRSS